MWVQTNKLYELNLKKEVMIMVFRYLVYLTLLGLLIFACEKDPTSPKGDPVVKLNGAFILNEGNFGRANGSLSFYSAEDGQVQNNIFSGVNGRALGDVVQSMTIIDTLGFIVVNNSNKIEVIGIRSWKSKATINMPAGSSPYYLADGGNGKAYITNLYTNSVSVLNLSTLQITGSIEVGANPEAILVHQGLAYVANGGFGFGNTVSVINLTTGLVQQNIRVGDNPRFLSVDAQDNLHVLCTGRYGDWNNPNDPGTDGGVYKISTANHQRLDSLVILGHPSRLAVDGQGRGYYIDPNNGGIVRYSLETMQVLNQNLIAGYYYSVSVDAVSEQIFVLDAKDYSQNGDLKIYDFNGQLRETHTVGIIPGSVTFVYAEEK